MIQILVDCGYSNFPVDQQYTVHTFSDDFNNFSLIEAEFISVLSVVGIQTSCLGVAHWFPGWRGFRSTMAWDRSSFLTLSFRTTKGNNKFKDDSFLKCQCSLRLVNVTHQLHRTPVRNCSKLHSNPVTENMTKYSSTHLIRLLSKL